MKKLAVKWRLFLRKVLIVCSCGAFAAACAKEEMIAEYGVPSIGGSVYAAVAQRPIPGIKVSLEETQETTRTGEYGNFYFSSTRRQGTLLLEDTDGHDNGGEFLNKTISFDRTNRLPNPIFMDLKE
jgi:hypothetical protein